MSCVATTWKGIARPDFQGRCDGHAAANHFRRGGPELLANGGPQHVTGDGPADVAPQVRNLARLDAALITESSRAWPKMRR